jgi:hypothetical protein
VAEERLQRRLAAILAADVVGHSRLISGNVHEHFQGATGLDFDDLSGDPERECFADGLTEDIITASSLWKSFPVAVGRTDGLATVECDDRNRKWAG